MKNITNREIKFRAWNTNKKMWCPDEYETHFPENEIGFILTGDRPETVLMQYTGLKDKNGKEIYEGDLITIYATDFSHSFPETIDDIFKAHKLCGESSTHWEVTGNIYQNPNLIK